MNTCTYCSTKAMLARLDETAQNAPEGSAERENFEGSARAIRDLLPRYGPCTCRFAPPAPELAEIAKKVLSHSKTVDAELLRDWAVQLATYVNGLSPETK